MSLIRYVTSNVYTLKKVCSLKNSNKYMNMACLEKAMSNKSARERAGERARERDKVFS